MTMSPTSSTWTAAGDIARGTVEWRTGEREREKSEEKKYDSMTE